MDRVGSDVSQRCGEFLWIYSEVAADGVVDVQRCLAVIRLRPEALPPLLVRLQQVQ